MLNQTFSWWKISQIVIIETKSYLISYLEKSVSNEKFQDNFILIVYIV